MIVSTVFLTIGIIGSIVCLVCLICSDRSDDRVGEITFLLIFMYAFFCSTGHIFYCNAKKDMQDEAVKKGHARFVSKEDKDGSFQQEFEWKSLEECVNELNEETLKQEK